MHVEIWEGNPLVQRFSCTEYDPRGYRSPRERLLVLAPTRILILEPSARFEGIAHLVVAATYTALAAVKWLNFNKEILNFYWKTGDGGDTAGQQLHFVDPSIVLEAIHSYSRSNGIEGVRIAAPEILNHSDISDKSTLDIERLKMEIDATESGVVSTPTLGAVNGLLATFQRVIEYYSAVGDPKYNDYLRRMHDVLHDQRIQSLLGYVDEVQREEGKETTVPSPVETTVKTEMQTDSRTGEELGTSPCLPEAASPVVMEESTELEKEKEQKIDTESLPVLPRPENTKEEEFPPSVSPPSN